MLKFRLTRSACGILVRTTTMTELMNIKIAKIILGFWHSIWSLMSIEFMMKTRSWQFRPTVHLASIYASDSFEGFGWSSGYSSSLEFNINSFWWIMERNLSMNIICVRYSKYFIVHMNFLFFMNESIRRISDTHQSTDAITGNKIL